VDKLYYDGSLERVAYDRIGKAFEKARNLRQYFGHESVPEVGLYYSARSRDWWGRSDAPRYMRSFWGAHLAMMHGHVPMGVIVDENMSQQEELQRYPVVLLAGTTILSDAEVRAFEAYVRGGGKLLVTGLTGVCDWFGNVQSHSSIEGLIGARLVGCELQHPDNYLRLPEIGEDSDPLGAILHASIEEPFDLLVYGPAAAYEPLTATAYGQLLVAYRSENNQWVNHMSSGKVIGPAFLVNKLGDGCVITVPCAIDAAYASDYRMPEHRRVLRSIVRYLNPKPAVEIVAPPGIETVVTRRKDGRLLVHFVAWSSPPTFSAVAFPQGKRVLPPIMEEAPCFEASVTLNAPVRNVRAVGRQSRVSRSRNLVKLSTKAVFETLLITTE